MSMSVKNVHTTILKTSVENNLEQVFNDPRRNPPFQIRGDGMEESVGSVNDLSTSSGSGLFLLPSVTSSIRPHGIPVGSLLYFNTFHHPYITQKP